MQIRIRKSVWCDIFTDDDNDGYDWQRDWADCHVYVWLCACVRDCKQTTTKETSNAIHTSQGVTPTDIPSAWVIAVLPFYPISFFLFFFTWTSFFGKKTKNNNKIWTYVKKFWTSFFLFKKKKNIPPWL